MVNSRRFPRICLDHLRDLVARPALSPLATGMKWKTTVARCLGAGLHMAWATLRKPALRSQKDKTQKPGGETNLFRLCQTPKNGEGPIPLITQPRIRAVLGDRNEFEDEGWVSRGI